MKTITEFLDMPETICEEQEVLNAVLCNDENEYPAFLPYKIEGSDFIVDCSQVKYVWAEQMKDDIVSAIDRRFDNFFLSRRDFNLVIIGID